MRLILFDIDGTLLSAHGAGSRALERALLARYGLAEGLAGSRLDGKTDPLIIREALERAGRRHDFDGGLSPEFRRTYARLLGEELERCSDFQVLPGVARLLSEMGRESDVLLGLATGNIEEGAWLKLEKAGLRSSFTFGGFGSDSEDRTQVVEKAIERGRAAGGGCAFSRIVAIGDTPRDILHAKQAGAETVAVATGSYSLSELQSHSPDLAVATLESTAEILAFLKTSRRG